MIRTNLYIAQFVGVTEDQWFGGRDYESPPVQSKKRYYLRQSLFVATDAEAAYRRIKDVVENDSDCNHDGEGDKTLFYNLGIHEIELLDWPLENLLEQVQMDYGVDLANVYPAEVDENGIPLIRTKQDLAIFRHSEETKRGRS